MLRVIGTVIAILIGVGVLAIATLAFLNKSPGADFGECQMRALEAPIPKEKMSDYLDACMASKGFKLYFRTCQFAADRGPWCYLSNRVIWIS